MKIKTVAVLGAGAVGSYIIWGLADRKDVTTGVIAEGERAERLKKGCTINHVTYHPQVWTPKEAHGADLLIVSLKYGALPGALQTFLDAHFAGRSPLPPPGLGVRLVPCTTLAGPCLLPAVPGLRLQAGQRQAQGFLTAFYCPAAPPDHWTLLLGPELAGELVGS